MSLQAYPNKKTIRHAARIVLLCMLWPGGVFAQGFKATATPEMVFSELRKNAAGVSSIQADFTEIRHASYLKEPQKSAGRFVYQKKNKMRWEQKVPSSYIILIDDNSLRVAENGTEKNMKAAGGMAGMVREMLLMMVNGDFQSNKGFEKKVFENNTEYQIVLTPVERRLKQRYDRLELNFLKSTLSLKQLAFFEKGGDKQLMTFHNEKVNDPVNLALFTAF